jgi:exonuclease SbcD
MIRILHTSDWHLGRFLYGKSLLEDQEFALEQLIDLIDRRRPHALLIAGDVFDRAFPPEAAVALFDRFLAKVVGERKVPIFLIPGNHDSCERLGFASALLREQGLTIFSSIEDSFKPVSVKGDNGFEIEIFGIPFVEPALIARALERDDLHTPDAAISALCRAIQARRSSRAPAVLLCHAFVTGSETCESEKDIFIGGSSNVDSQTFRDFVYTALGHLHKPQSAGTPNIRYSGSLLPYSKSEIDHVKSITELVIASDASVRLDTHRLKNLRGLRYLEGLLEDLLGAGPADPAPDDYIIAGFTDGGPVLDAFSRLRVFYPNLLNVARAGGYMPSELPALRRQERAERSELDLFAEFFRESVGEDLNGEERSALASMLQELASQETGKVAT